ncbi:nucleotidyltransferase family protein [Cryobacterium sp. 5B3]|uniref:nucleotidyltransferase family protein n=1 Tax=Cryobacterium sp. 5B3 TaxID=3048586 RepID=UPI002AB3B50C|nr:NTP transferase domain-containing protein [Cryobacterium sp. 5B3]MDY7543520.1 NTP transferase domain-containing protein [Cryobacterium sp. 5B3]MEB0273122.1 NTP transferase domain-containing protein [Cryobacterium sp. 5B3]
MMNTDAARDRADVGKAPVAGLVLAAGAGSRFGQPKALVRGADGVPWLVRTVGVLRAAGCSPVIVVLGAEGAAAAALLAEAGPTDPTTVVAYAPDWAEGLSASLRTGLEAALRVAGDPVAVAVVPVDVPDLDAATVARVLDADAGVTPDSLRQAVFGGRPGHPVLIGRTHWEPLRVQLTGDTGARPYLLAHGVLPVECGDLTTGADVDTLPGVPEA